MGRMPGKHLVMRAMNDAREHEAIERVFAQSDEGERRALYHERKQHKTVTVFLHEIGHTLGVPHEIDPAGIMQARYDPKARGFSAGAVGLMRLSLAHRLDPAAQTPQAFAAAFTAELDRGTATWVPADREALLATLRAATPPPVRPGRRDRSAGGAVVTAGRWALHAHHHRSQRLQPRADRQAGGARARGVGGCAAAVQDLPGCLRRAGAALPARDGRRRRLQRDRCAVCARMMELLKGKPR